MSARRQPLRASRGNQRGFSAGLVLAVLVLLGGMLAHAVTSTSSSHDSLAREIMQSRAQQGAHAGLDWARYHLRFTAGYCPSPTGSTTNLRIPLSPATSPAPPFEMPVTVTCQFTGTHTEASNTVRTYHLTANACSPAGPGGACPNPAASADYVERQVTGIAER